MAAIHKLVPGQIVYQVKNPASIFSKREYYPVRIIEIDLERHVVYASWNNNPPFWYGEHSISRWRIKKPVAK